MSFPESRRLEVNSSAGSLTSEETVKKLFSQAVSRPRDGESEKVKIMKQIYSIVDKITVSKEEGDGLKERIRLSVLNSNEEGGGNDLSNHVLENLHLVKAMAFPNYESLVAFVCESKKKNDLVPKKKGKTTVLYPLTLTPMYCLNLVLANPCLVSFENVGFKNLLKNFLKAENGVISDPTGQLSQIREFARRNANFYLGHKQKTLPLAEYFDSNPKEIRYVPATVVESVIKKIASQKGIHYNLINNEDRIGMCFNCFHCVSATPFSEQVKKKSSFEFNPEALALFNTFRARVFENSLEVKAHFLKHHSPLGRLSDFSKKTQSSKTASEHGLLLVCGRCNVQPEKYTSTSIVCCEDCLNRHCLLLHSKEDRFLSFHQQLKSEYFWDSVKSEISESYFLVKCDLCLLLFPNKTERDKHMTNLCIPRMIASSYFYGNPFISDRPFETKISIAARQEKETEILAKQVKLFLNKMKSHSEYIPVAEKSVDENTFETMKEHSDNDESEMVVGVKEREQNFSTRKPSFRSLLSNSAKEVVTKKSPSSSLVRDSSTSSPTPIDVSNENEEAASSSCSRQSMRYHPELSCSEVVSLSRDSRQDLVASSSTEEEIDETVEAGKQKSVGGGCLFLDDEVKEGRESQKKKGKDRNETERSKERNVEEKNKKKERSAERKTDSGESFKKNEEKERKKERSTNRNKRKTDKRKQKKKERERGDEGKDESVKKKARKSYEESKSNDETRRKNTKKQDGQQPQQGRTSKDEKKKKNKKEQLFARRSGDEKKKPGRQNSMENSKDDSSSLSSSSSWSSDSSSSPSSSSCSSSDPSSSSSSTDPARRRSRSRKTKRRKKSSKTIRSDSGESD